MKYLETIYVYVQQFFTAILSFSVYCRCSSFKVTICKVKQFISRTMPLVYSEYQSIAHKHSTSSPTTLLFTVHLSIFVSQSVCLTICLSVFLSTATFVCHCLSQFFFAPLSLLILSSLCDLSQRVAALGFRLACTSLLMSRTSHHVASK